MRRYILLLAALLPIGTVSLSATEFGDKAPDTAPPTQSTYNTIDRLIEMEQYSPFNDNDKFLPTKKRIDREINKIKFALKGEIITGLTASYGSLSSDDSSLMLILDNIDADGVMASVKPYVGYFYRDNRCIGVRFGYQYTDGTLNSAKFDMGESNDISAVIPYVDTNSESYSVGIFHRSYAGLDANGHFGVFAEFELAASMGSSEFAYESGGEIKRTYSDNTEVALSFNPGVAAYIFPNVCATVSFGFGGLRYSKVEQRDALGADLGSREYSDMKFKFNVLAINIGMTIHLWSKK